MDLQGRHARRTLPRDARRLATGRVHDIVADTCRVTCAPWENELVARLSHERSEPDAKSPRRGHI